MTVSTAFSPSRVARGVAIKVYPENLGPAGTRFRPVSIAVFGQGSHGVTYSTTKRRVYSANEVGSVYGYTSPLYLAVLSLLPPSGDGVGDIPVWVYPLAEPDPGVSATGGIAPTGAGTKRATYYALVNNVRSNAISVEVGETVATFCAKATAAINAVVGMPGTASDGTTDIDFTVGWEGASGDDVVLEMESPDDAEFTFVITQPTGGSGTVAVTSALAQIGEAWDTHIINCQEYTNSTVLAAFAAANEGRWDPEVHKPFKVYTGTAEATLATVTAVTDAMSEDRTNIILTNPGSNDLPLVIAADQVRRIAKLANENPAHDYGSRKCPRLTPGSDGDQWTSAERQSAVLAGCSTIKVKGGVVNISDVVTTYHPTGEEPPAYRYDCDIEKLSTVIYNTWLIFDSEEWDGAPLVPDDQAVKNPTAKKPKMAMAAIYKMFDALADDAIISDPDFAKESSSASIGSTNPKRLDLKLVFKLSGNANVISIDLAFGFYYGE